MSCREIGIDLFLMTRTAGAVSRVATIFFLRRIPSRGRGALWYGIRRRTQRQSENGEANRGDETRGANEMTGARGIYPPTGLGYGNFGAANIGISSRELRSG